jgi:hypothetical protein
VSKVVVDGATESQRACCLVSLLHTARKGKAMTAERIRLYPI